MYYGSGTVANDVTWAQRRQTLLHVAYGSWKYDIIIIIIFVYLTERIFISKIRLRQSMRIYLNNLVKFHPDLTVNDGDLGFFEDSGVFLKTPPPEQQDEYRYGIGSSVPDPNLHYGVQYVYTVKLFLYFLHYCWLCMHVIILYVVYNLVFR